MKEARIRLATQGDDLGMNHTTNLAFVDAFKNGLLRNAAILAPSPAIEEAADLLAKEKGLGISLHTCMNAEWDTYKWGPVLPPDKVPSLVDKNGMFFQTTEALYENHPRLEEIFAELQAQLERARALGFNVRLADAHMGWTWILKDNMELFHNWRRSNGLLDHQPYSRLPDVRCMADPVELLILKLERAEPGQYWIGGHPSYDNPEMRSCGHPRYESDIVAVSRDWERRIHTDPRILKYCADHGIKPIRHEDALAPVLSSAAQ